MSTNESLSDTTLTDYDAAWDRDDAPDDNQGVDAEGQYQQTDVDDPASETPAPKADTEEPGEEPKTPAAEQEDDGNTPGDGSSSPEEALRQAEIEISALRGQNKALNDRLSSRGRELKELRDKVAELETKTREPTKFEQEFPEYADDIRKLTGQDNTNSAEPEVDPADAQAETVDKILQAHPDAGTLYNSAELHEFLKNDPVFVFDGNPQFVNHALHSDNADEVIAALAYFKANAGSSQSTPPGEPETPAGKKDPLGDLEEPAGKGGSPSVPNAARSPLEEYEAAWAADDI